MSDLHDAHGIQGCCDRLARQAHEAEVQALRSARDVLDTAVRRMACAPGATDMQKSWAATALYESARGAREQSVRPEWSFLHDRKEGTE